jgi:mono/diheme cytochrome c family protein
MRLNIDRRFVHRSRLWLAVLFALAGMVGSTIAQADRRSEVRFNRDIRPILAENCLACHGFDGAKREAGLRLDLQEGATQELESGARAIVPGDAAASELVTRIRSRDPDTAMPPPSSGKRLDERQMRLLEEWIKEGAAYQGHWAFQPLMEAPIPAAHPISSESPDRSQARVEGPIDSFVQERLPDIGLAASPQASHEKLMRRVSLDLIGMIPQPAEMDAFLEQCRSDPDNAYAQLVDRLLSNPHYGERWGRWWLDQARYSDSNGYSIDAPRQIWKFRDWVVQAFNADLPFDRFTIEQLAGDLLPEATDANRIATGFHRNTPINQEGGIDVEQFRIDSVFDRVATTGTVWLGLSIGCAQCHNHKFDPISQKEYYQLFAFLNNQDEPTITVRDAVEGEPALRDEQRQLHEGLLQHIQENRATFDQWRFNLPAKEWEGLPPAAKAALKKATKDEWASGQEKWSMVEWAHVIAASPLRANTVVQSMISRFQEIEGSLSGQVTTMVLKERLEPRKTTVLIQGDFTRPSEQVWPGTPKVLHPLVPPQQDPTAEIPPSPASLLNRLDLARWIASPVNPLTPRVITNRVWLQMFGRGLVETENDFGLQGSPPSHPELLDWLAREFVGHDWSIKHLHRTIVLSHTYRQSSDTSPQGRQRDPENYWLSRQRRLRLDAELVRDAGLVASGLLAARVGGPPVFPPIPDGVLSLGQVKRPWVASVGADRHRRGLYTFIYRATPAPSLNVFDAPEGISSCTRRVRSNTPLQSLTLLNDRAFVEFAQALGSRIVQEGLSQAFRRCTSRFPSEEELAVFRELDSLSAARVLLNLDETITRD